MRSMVLVRILLGAAWLNGGVEKLLNPEFPRQFAQSLQAGGFISQAPPFFQEFMRATVLPHAEAFARLQTFGEMALGIALFLGLLSNPAALGSALLSATILLSQGGVRLGSGLGSPEFLNMNLLLALLSLVVLRSASAKAFSVDALLARRIPGLSPMLVNRRARGAD